MNFDTGTSTSQPASPIGGEFNYKDPVQSFIDSVKRVILQPSQFFSGIARNGDFLNPLIFALICLEVTTILGGIIAIVGISGNQSIGGLIGAMIFAPIAGAILLFIWAGILHLLVMLIVGSGNAGFEATFRTVSYSSAPALVSWIPFIGALLNLYSIYLAIVGIREMHNTSTGKAALVVLIPVAVVLILGLLLLMVVGAALFGILSMSQ